MRRNEKTISFRAVAETIAELDSLAAAQDRPRSYLINEAIGNYIELHAYQDALVRKGVEEMPFLAAYAVERADIVVLANYHGAGLRASVRAPVPIVLTGNKDESFLTPQIPFGTTKSNFVESREHAK